MSDRDAFSFASIEEAAEDLRAGKFVVVVDDEDRENEGDLTIAAEKVTPEAINFMKWSDVAVHLTGQAHMVDALALEGDEGRRKLR